MAEQQEPLSNEASTLQNAILDFVAGDDGAGDRICRALQGPVRLAAGRFFPQDVAETDDVTQDTLVAVLAYLRKRGGFSGDLIKFAVTVASNRCRNILNWRKRWPQVPVEKMPAWQANPHRSPLDFLLENEIRDLLQEGLDRLDRPCRELLVAFFLEESSIEEIRTRTGLTTVQGVYYRKSVCLNKMMHFLKRRMAGGSSG
jgi:RNA polymerase sigma factor (sigma-70 family)